MTDIRISQKMKRKASWVEKKVLQNGKSNWKKVSVSSYKSKSWLILGFSFKLLE